MQENSFFSKIKLVPQKKRIFFGEQEFSKNKKPEIVFCGFVCFTFFEPFVSPGNENGDMDVYILEKRGKGDMSEKGTTTAIILSFSKIHDHKFRLTKQFILSGSDSSYCKLIISRFAVLWAKKNKMQILGCPWRKNINYKK